MNLVGLLPHICRTAVEAGELIEKIYYAQQQVEVESKSDGTPVTIADKLADNLICDALRAQTPQIPLVTEESIESVPFEIRQAWSTYWCVDPLDGTKEFIERTGEFSVNIGLIEEGRVLLGVVYVPLTRVIYCAIKGHGAYRLEIPNAPNEQTWKACLDSGNRITSLSMQEKLPTKVAVSRRHGSRVDRFMSALGECELVYMGSAIKSCLVAEGEADVYPRFGPTSFWDTAAAQCVVEEAGGRLVDANNQPLNYIQTESLLNPHFMVVGDPDYNWPDFPKPV